MNPQEFDALVSTGTGFYTQNQMVTSGVNTQMSQQVLGSVQAMQTPVPMGDVPAPPKSPVFERIAQQQQAAQQQVPAQAPQIVFFVLINNEQKGPLTLEQLKGLAIADVITPESMVWQQGTPAWVDLKTCLANLQV